MPIYEYLCDNCGARYERVVLSQNSEIACPKCSSKRRTVQFSTFSAPSGNGSSSSAASSESSAGGCRCTPRTCGCH